ncbi:MAG TPA: NUDIX domain-containing protein [Chloroflexaceae bacterium]|nr:NUDIX domain-containing protein [Chloroflexaceae bacterium]
MSIRAVGAVALREAPGGMIEVLLIRKRGGMWTLPKGRVKRGETDEQALARELAEETGLRGEVGEAISQSMYRVQKAGQRRRKTVVYYLIWNTRGELRPGVAEDIAEARWMPLHRALKRIGRPRIRAVVRSALTLV